MSTIDCIIVGCEDEEEVCWHSLQWHGADFAMTTYIGP